MSPSFTPQWPSIASRPLVGGEPVEFPVPVGAFEVRIRSVAAEIEVAILDSSGEQVAQATKKQESREMGLACLGASKVRIVASGLAADAQIAFLLAPMR